MKFTPHNIVIENLIVGLDIYSYHFNRSAGYENFTPGFYVAQETENVCAGFAGIYRNSENGVSLIAGCQISRRLPQSRSASISVAFGGATGYRRAAVTPIIYPSLTIGVEKNTNFRIGYIPRVSGFTNSAVLHFQVERRF